MDFTPREKIPVTMKLRLIRFLAFVRSLVEIKVESKFNQGNGYVDLSQYELAIHDYCEVIRLNPQDADAYFNRGNTYVDLNQYELAILDYDESPSGRSMWGKLRKRLNL